MDEKITCRYCKTFNQAKDEGTNYRKCKVIDKKVAQGTEACDKFELIGYIWCEKKEQKKSTKTCGMQDFCLKCQHVKPIVSINKRKALNDAKSTRANG